ncbi:MAG: hypothetical protein M0R80_00615 [Proteobacteria bacterium]|jgi:hypothetical protein|nr:hypothetical protein [Pseudomonadota bacterium]
MEFREWLLENAGAPGSKQSLYPMSYGGIGLYPPSDLITWSADAVTYMPIEDRKLKFAWGKGMLSKPEGLEIQAPAYEKSHEETGKPNFIWGKGMLAKPAALIDTIKTLHTQDRDGVGLKFIWGKDMLSRPDGIDI